MTAEPLKSNSLYDPDDAEAIDPSTKPDLHVVKSGAKKPAKQPNPKSGSDSSAALKKAEESWGSAGVVEDKEEGSKESPSSAIGKAEQSWGTAGVVGAGAAAGGEAADQVGSGFNPTASPSRLNRFKNNLSRNKKRGLIGGGIFGGTGAIIVALFLALVPLKIEHIINNLRDHFLATASGALQTENLNIFKQYMTKYVGQGLKGCNTTISPDCHVIVTGHGPIFDLYRTWANAHFERNLALKYHVEITYVKDSAGGKYFIKTPRTAAEQIGENGSINDAEWAGKEVSSAGLLEEEKLAIADETLWKRVYIRFKLNAFNHEKFNTPKCLVACSIVNPFHNFTNQLKLTAKYFIAKNVLYPLSEADGLAAMCFLDPACNSTSVFTENQAEDSAGSDIAEMNGAPVSEASAQLRAEVAKLLASESASLSADEFAKLVGDMEDKGLSAVIIGNLVTKVLTALGVEGASSAGEATADAVPIIGWIELASQIVNSSKNIGKNLKKLSYLVLAAASAGTFYTLATEASEMKAGKETSDQVGSFINSLGSGNQSVNVGADGTVTQGSGASQVGGTASAEGTPLYAQLIDGQKNVDNASFTNYTCEPVAPLPLAPTPAPTTVPAGQTVCPIEQFGQGNAFFNTISSFWNIGCVGTIPGTSIPFSPIPESPCSISGLAQVWADTVGKVYNVINGAIGFLFSTAVTIENAIPCGGGLLGDITNVLGFLIPGHAIWCAAKGLVKAVAPTILHFIEKYLLPSPFAADMSGGRTFDMAAAGSDVTGNDYTHNGLGGMTLKPNQVAQIQNQQNQEDLAEFEDEPLLSRLFDTSSQFSLVSKLAMDAPLNSFGVTLSSSAGSFLSNPFKGLVSGIASLLSPPQAYAATLATDPFGIQQYGYPDDGSANSISTDPTGYYNAHCQDQTQTDTWNSQALANATLPTNDTGEPYNTTTNQCLLINASVGSVGAIYDQNLLTPDELAFTGASSANTTTSTNNEIYQVGDSLSTGMELGGIQPDYQTNGWTVSKYEATVGDSVAAAIPKVRADATAVQASGTVVVELGTNNLGDNEGQFETQIQNMISAIRAINPTAQIDWVNTYSALNPNYQVINQAIANEASTLNFKVIDWAGQVLANPSAYVFDKSLGVHLTASGYQLMASFVANTVGPAPTPTAMETTDNVVAQAVEGPQNNSPSVFATFFGDIAKTFKSIGETFRNDAVIFYRRVEW